MSDEAYKEMVSKELKVVCAAMFPDCLSRRFQQKFIVMSLMFIVLYAASILHHIYFYFDYGDYKLMGSSPESQLIIKDGKAIVTIAGTLNVR